MAPRSIVFSHSWTNRVFQTNLSGASLFNWINVTVSTRGTSVEKRLTGSIIIYDLASSESFPWQARRVIELTRKTMFQIGNRPHTRVLHTLIKFPEHGVKSGVGKTFQMAVKYAHAIIYFFSSDIEIEIYEAKAHTQRSMLSLALPPVRDSISNKIYVRILCCIRARMENCSRGRRSAVFHVQHCICSGKVGPNVIVSPLFTVFDIAL